MPRTKLRVKPRVRLVNIFSYLLVFILYAPLVYLLLVYTDLDKPLYQKEAYMELKIPFSIFAGMFLAGVHRWWVTRHDLF